MGDDCQKFVNARPSDRPLSPGELLETLASGLVPWSVDAMRRSEYWCQQRSPASVLVSEGSDGTPIIPARSLLETLAANRVGLEARPLSGSASQTSWLVREKELYDEPLVH